MTCIVGLVASGVVYMGADSASVGGASNLIISRAPKVARVGPYLIGFTSSWRMGQLLHHTFKPPKPDKAALMGFMVAAFVDAARDCLKRGGFASKTNETEAGGNFLVAVCGRLFEIGDDYQVAETENGYVACGSGSIAAHGSMHSTRDLMPPRDRVLRALEAAAAHNAYVHPPFHIEVSE